MFKRFIARLLIVLQVYGTIFQGVVHANVLQAYPMRDEIYLHGSFHKDGGLRLTLGTNAVSGQDLEVLGQIDVPTYKALKSLASALTSRLPSLALTQPLKQPAASSVLSERDRPKTLEFIPSVAEAVFAMPPSGRAVEEITLPAYPATIL